MSRKAISKSKHIQRVPDQKYGDLTISLLTNMVMKNGKKSCARKIVYGAISEAIMRCHQSEELKKYFNENEVNLKSQHDVELATMLFLIGHIQPPLEVKSRRIGGANYQVPVLVSKERGTTLALRWIIAAARARKGASMIKRLADELVDISYSRGQSWNTKKQMERMADANRVFANMRKAS
jgi:small subunit ribosomal protein S7